MALFKKGQSGNPGGRPKGLSAYVQAKVGKHGQELVDLLYRIARDPKEETRDRIKAIHELLDRGWNKPTQGIHFDEAMRPLVIDLVTEADVAAQRRADQDA